MYKRLLFIFCLFTLLTNGQEVHPQFNLNLSLALPINQLGAINATAENELAAFGLGGGFLLHITENLPFKAGINLRYMWLGSKSKSFDLVDDEGYAYNFESKVKGSMTPMHLMLRVDPMHYTNFPIMPYVGGFTGFRFFGSNRKFTVDYNDGSEPLVENKRKLSVTSSYGFEIGLHIRISKDMMLDFRYEHAYGGWAEYLDVSSIEINENGDATYQYLETRTDVSMYTLGIVTTLN